TFTPNAGFTGTTTYTYQVCLAAPHGTVCDTAVVTVVVDPIPAIDAVDDNAGTTPEAAPETTPVQGNDVPTPLGLDPFSVSVAVPSLDLRSSPTRPSSALTFTPNAGFTGTTTYTYQVCLAAPHGAVCDTAVVTVVVDPIPAIDAVDDNAGTTPEATPVTTPVLGNDVPTHGSLDPSSVKVTVPSVDGSTSVDAATGAITFTPNAGFTGTT